MKDDDRFIFEASWEVCHKVGGIFTVVKSKAALLSERYSNYILVGPYFKESAEVEFVEDTLPHGFGDVFKELEDEGIKCHYGHWEIKGSPKTILIDFSGVWDKHDSIKTMLWEEFKIDSMNSGIEFDEAVMWSTSVGMLIEKFCKKKKERGEDGECVLHAHEWLSGASILYTKQANLPVGTIFTTHATMLGRTLAGSGRDLYDELDNINPEEEAKKSGIMPKFTMEKAVANTCDVFTTVSEITGLEAEKLLGRKPDILVLNGLDAERMPTYEESAVNHKHNKQHMHEFLEYHFLPYYYFDIENTLIFFMVGRYEYKNKGVDLVVEALGQLNDRLKKEKDFDKNIVCFFWIPRDVQGVKTEVSINKTSFDTLHDFVDENMDEFRKKLVKNILKLVKGGNNVSDVNLSEQLFDKDMLKMIKRLGINFAKRGNPPMCTHNISYENEDLIISNLRRVGIDNKKDDKVKAVLYPLYLSGVDGLIDLGYYDAMNACHLGLFPSYYEPWGYTPLECASLGVPSLTSDLSGFGKFLQTKSSTDAGIYVLKRHNKEWNDTVKRFSDILYKFTKFNTQERVQQKILAKELSNLADWKVLIENYFKAHDLAIQKVRERK